MAKKTKITSQSLHKIKELEIFNKEWNKEIFKSKKWKEQDKLIKTDIAIYLLKIKSSKRNQDKQ